MPNQTSSSSPFQLGRALALLTPLACVTLLSISCAPTSPSTPFESSAKEFDRQGEKLATTAVNSLGCANSESEETSSSDSMKEFTSRFYDSLYDVVLAHQSFAPKDQVRETLRQVLPSSRLSQLSAEEQAKLVAGVSDLYEYLTTDVIAALAKDPYDDHDLLEALTAIEMQDTSTPIRARLVIEVRLKLANIASLLAAHEDFELPPCPRADVQSRTPAFPSPKTLLGRIRATSNPVVYGGYKALAVAYQSCDTPTDPVLSPETPDLRGITITGHWPNSPGLKREITNLNELILSHPYLHDYEKPRTTCFDVLKNPLIYDYGGKPSTSTGAGGELDFFTDSGGTKALGIDCSGYVFSSLATAGLRLTKGQNMKPVFVHNTNAAKFMEPKQNGFSCFDEVQISAASTMKAGDILASSGHVLIVARVGADPFGVREARSDADCKVGNMSTARFDFDILQSASTKGGIGVNHIQAVKFIDDEPAMAKGLLQYAVAACHARFEKKTLTVRPESARLVRHSSTSECTAPPVKLTHEDCVASCPLN